jgi:hypothetical protein
MQKIDYADIIGCTVQVGDSQEDGKFIPKLKLAFYSKPDEELVLGDPCEPLEAAMMAAIGAGIIMARAMILSKAGP